MIYFQVPARLRPDNWNPSNPIGDTRTDDLQSIIKKGEDLYQELQNAKAGITSAPAKGSLSDLIILYKESEHWINTKPATKEGYQHFLKTIDLWSKNSGDPHIEKYNGKHISAFLNKWSDKPRTRKFYKSILSKLFLVGIENGFIEKNIVSLITLPKEKNKKQWKLWEYEDIIRFINQADKMNKWNVGTAVLIAYETGQRLTDIIRFQQGKDYIGGNFTFRTSKTDKPLNIPASDLLKARLSEKPPEQLVLTVHDSTGKLWDRNSFNKAFRRVLKGCGMEGYQFRKIRNSVAIKAEQAGLSDGEFKSLFGWEKPDKMLNDFYSDRSQGVADRGIMKLTKMKKEKR